MTNVSKVAITDDDIAAVGRVPQRIMVAWARNSADAFASVFTDDATVILPGGIYLKGRAAILSFMTAEYSGRYKGTLVTGEPIDVKFISDIAGVLVTKGGVLTRGESEVSAERAIRATWVLAKQGDEWFISAYHNSLLIDSST
jgi:uncharacterized protein (TIGR02246 family)